MQRLWEIRIDSINRRLDYLESNIERELRYLREEMRRELRYVDRRIERLDARLNRRRHCH
jgi:hypothetical protein